MIKKGRKKATERRYGLWVTVIVKITDKNYS